MKFSFIQKPLEFDSLRQMPISIVDEKKYLLNQVWIVSEVRHMLRHKSFLFKENLQAIRPQN